MCKEGFLSGICFLHKNILKLFCVGQVLEFIPALIIESFKTLCPFGISCTQNQVALGAWAVR